jgi:hypothetical protein
MRLRRVGRTHVFENVVIYQHAVRFLSRRALEVSQRAKVLRVGIGQRVISQHTIRRSLPDNLRLVVPVAAARALVIITHSGLTMAKLPYASNLETTAQSDYERYRQAVTPVEQQALLDELLTRHAAPLAQAILRKKLQPYSADHARDITQQIHLNLLTRLQTNDETQLQDFAAYVAVVAFHTCAEWQRQRQPQRHALKNRLRYLLTHTEDFACWEAQPRVWWCGRRAWQTHKPTCDWPRAAVWRDVSVRHNPNYLRLVHKLEDAKQKHG